MGQKLDRIMLAFEDFKSQAEEEIQGNIQESLLAMQKDLRVKKEKLLSAAGSSS